jgi:hypothetical protein
MKGSDRPKGPTPVRERVNVVEHIICGWQCRECLECVDSITKLPHQGCQPHIKRLAHVYQGGLLRGRERLVRRAAIRSGSCAGRSCVG